jgi:hypothetical protein
VGLCSSTGDPADQVGGFAFLLSARELDRFLVGQQLRGNLSPAVAAVRAATSTAPRASACFRAVAGRPDRPNQPNRTRSPVTVEQTSFPITSQR